MMELRRFNDKGIAAFGDYLTALRQDPQRKPPMSLLTDAGMSETLDPPIVAEPEPFENHMAFARWLDAAANAVGAQIPRVEAGFWAWLTFALFDQVCPEDGDGRRKPEEDPRYLPTLVGARQYYYYRHALLGPYLVFMEYADNPDHVAVLLRTKQRTVNTLF